jgi:L-ribulose-5-phosphate 4-epimerase
MSGAYGKLKELAHAANLEIPARGLAIYTFGNASAYDPALGAFAIKPSGVPYAELRPEDYPVLDIHGAVLEGSLRPSSDAPTHASLYRWFKEIGLDAKLKGVAHSHSTYATAWAQARRSIPLYGTTHADHMAFEVPCTDMMSEEGASGEYELATGALLRDAFEGLKLSPLEAPMALVAGHGPFTWGRDAAQAVYHAAVLEEIARMASLTEALSGGARRLPEHIVRKHYERKHGPKAYYGQPGKAKERSE